MARAENLAIVITPLVAMATFALGLRLGAKEVVTAAIVFGAPPSAGRPGLAWQVLTLRDERGVRESIPMRDLSIVARSAGREAYWRGDSNVDGIAEAWLDLPNVHLGDSVDLVVRANGEDVPLAEGRARWSQEAWAPPASGSPWVRASKRDGELAIDVAVYGQKLAPGFATSIWVRVIDGAHEPVSGANVEADPEPGLEVQNAHATTCTSGWAEIVGTAQMHVIGLALHATKQLLGSTTRGEWYGSLPVAPGGSFVALPNEASPREPIPLRVIVPTVRPLVYLEVDDAHGRAFAATLLMNASDRDLPHALVTLPPLGDGLYWVVTAGEPRGAESLEVATIARPFLVRERPPLDSCEVGPLLATKAAAPFSKWVALDGTSSKQSQGGARRKGGIVLAFGSLATAAVLEALLVLRVVARARAEMARVAAALSDGDRSPPELAPRFSLATVVIGLAVALLGFAFVASLLTWHAS